MPKATTAAARSSSGRSARASYKRATSSVSETPSVARTLSAIVPGAMGRSRGERARSFGTMSRLRGERLERLVRPAHRLGWVGVRVADLLVEVEVDEQLGRAGVGVVREVLLDLLQRPGELLR